MSQGDVCGMSQWGMSLGCPSEMCGMSVGVSQGDVSVGCLWGCLWGTSVGVSQ